MRTILPIEMHTITEMNELLDLKIKVLDQGHIRVVDWMGGDTAVVQAARVSYGKGTKTFREDRQLIRRLVRYKHTTPLEMAEIKFHVRVPMDIWRQWIRTRTASVNEYSTRYSEAIDAVAETEPWMWRRQSKTNKQGSAEYFDSPEGETFTAMDAALQEHAERVYKEKINRGVAREQARQKLLLANYTEAYWKIDLHNLMNFLRLRVASDAQWEIQQYANVLAQVVKLWCPLVWEAFEDFTLHSKTFSRHEMEVLHTLIGQFVHPKERIETLLDGMSKREGHPVLTPNELNELFDKLKL